MHAKIFNFYLILLPRHIYELLHFGLPDKIPINCIIDPGLFMSDHECKSETLNPEGPWSRREPEMVLCADVGGGMMEVVPGTVVGSEAVLKEVMDGSDRPR